MFLICNGVLVFLAKNSLINSSSPPPSPLLSDSHFEFVNLSETKTPVSDDMIVVPLECYSESPEDPLMAEVEQDENYEEVLEAEEQKEEGITESEACMEEEEKEVIKLKGGITESEVKVTQDEEDELAEDTMMTGNEELANTEDLNRKFEEFIRKMKEEMRIEAQRHLIAV